MAGFAYDYIIKLLMIGDSSVGKSCLLLRFVDNTFTPTFITTIGIDFKIRTVEINGKKIKVQVWDTAGQERFRTITTAYYRGAHGILLVYDITNRASFNNITNWMQQLEQHATGGVSKILVGNKSDLDDSRQISFQEGKDRADEYKCCFFETSAKTGSNVDPAFRSLLETVYHTKILPACPPTSKSIELTQPIGPNKSCC